MDVSALLPLLLLVVVGYLLLIRPARTRAKATATLQSALSPGDEVMLSSGLFGTVVDVAGEVARVEIADDTIVRVHRGAVTQIVVDSPAVEDPADDIDDSADEYDDSADEYDDSADEYDDEVGGADDEPRDARDKPLGDTPGVN